MGKFKLQTNNHRIYLIRFVKKYLTETHCGDFYLVEYQIFSWRFWRGESLNIFFVQAEFANSASALALFAPNRKNLLKSNENLNRYFKFYRKI